MALNGKVIFPENPVLICTTCGCGFLVSQPGNRHLTPMWFTSFSQSGNACDGAIMLADRRLQIKSINDWELSNAVQVED